MSISKFIVALLIAMSTLFAVSMFFPAKVKPKQSDSPQAVAPSDHVMKNVNQMEVGDCGYIFDSDVQVDASKKVYVSSISYVRKAKTEVFIKRTDNGYEITASPKTSFKMGTGYGGYWVRVSFLEFKSLD